MLGECSFIAILDIIELKLSFVQNFEKKNSVSQYDNAKLLTACLLLCFFFLSA